jgi:hypothetical protein
VGALKRATRRWARHDGLTPKDAATLDAVKRAKPPKRDETAAIELAQEFGADVADVLELFAEREAIRLYEANAAPDDAHAGALEDVRDILTRRANAVQR